MFFDFSGFLQTSSCPFLINHPLSFLRRSVLFSPSPPPPPLHPPGHNIDFSSSVRTDPITTPDHYQRLFCIFIDVDEIGMSQDLRNLLAWHDSNLIQAKTEQNKLKLSA